MNSKLVSTFALAMIAMPMMGDAEILTRLPTAQSPDLADNATYTLAAGAARGMDSTFVGVRGNLLYSESVELFVEGGVIDLEDAETDGTAFGGGIFTQLPVEAPFSVGLRGSFNYALTDGDNVEYDFWVLTALLVIGGETAIDRLDWYANIGFAHQDGDFERDTPGPLAVEGDFESETEFQFGAGGTYDLTDALSIFGAFDVVAADDLFLSVGLRAKL